MSCIPDYIGCVSQDGCPPGVCPYFQIRRFDTRPELRLDITTCEGVPTDLTGLVCEASMWAKGRLKKKLLAADTTFALADGVGFNQVAVGDVIVTARARSPEQMLVTGFDEDLKLVEVQRGYNGSAITDHPKGTALKMFRVLNAVAGTEMVKEDIPQVDGTIQDGVLTRSTLVYEWAAADTELAGCYWFEFKLLSLVDNTDGMGAEDDALSFVSYTQDAPDAAYSDEMVIEIDGVHYAVPATLVTGGISSISSASADPSNIIWVRRYPTTAEGLLVHIYDSPTAENITT